MIVIQIAIWILLGIVGGTILARKGYSPNLGIAIGVFLGPLGLLVAALIPATSEAHRQATLRRETDAELSAAAKTHPCPNCGRHNSVATRVCPRCEYRFS